MPSERKRWVIRRLPYIEIARKGKISELEYKVGMQAAIIEQLREDLSLSRYKSERSRWP